ncbi:MAG: SPOR domain-containing protein [Bacteroidetes bacterium]|nr:SPOR domain-containing protein [Bacteroidota bacterium]MDA1269391.1 SPOR domain-containing protein [Bacteroidota bacterium]
MAEKESNPKQWSDPKDFGLPFVDISPLSELKSKAKEAKVTEPTLSLELPKTASVVAEEKKQETKPSRPVAALTPAEKNKKKKSKTWVWVLLFAFIAAVSIIVFQLKIIYAPIEGNENLVVNPPITPITPKPLVDSALLAQTNADSLPIKDSTLISNSELSSASANSGISIAINPKITRVDQKEGKTRYFLVVGSFGSEEETARYIQKVGNKFSEYYLVYPYGQNPYYRLAIGAYGTSKEASIKLTEMKAQNANRYWILNY